MKNSAGLHLIMDVYVSDSDVFEPEYLSEMFKELASILDMTIIMGPNFLEVPVDPAILAESERTGKFMDEGGCTGFCVISTSHCSIHTWPLKKFASLDIFSCKEFDSDKAEEFIVTKLKCTSVSKHVVNRSKPNVI